MILPLRQQRKQKAIQHAPSRPKHARVRVVRRDQIDSRRTPAARSRLARDYGHRRRVGCRLGARIGAAIAADGYWKASSLQMRRDDHVADAVAVITPDSGDCLTVDGSIVADEVANMMPSEVDWNLDVSARGGIVIRHAAA